MGFGQIVHQQGIAVHVPHGRGVVDRRFLERQDDLVPEPQQRLDDPQIKGKAALHRADVEERARRAGEKLLHLRDEGFGTGKDVREFAFAAFRRRAVVDELGEGMVRAPGKVEEAGQLSQIQRAAQIGDALGAQAVGQASEGLLQGLRTEEGGERFVVEQALVQPRIARVEMADERGDQPLDEAGGQDIAEREATPETVAAIVDHVAALLAVLFVADDPDDGAPCRDILAAHAGRKTAEVEGGRQFPEGGVGTRRVHLPFVHGDHEAELLRAGDAAGVDAVFDVVFRAKAVEPRIEAGMVAEPEIADLPDVGKPVHTCSGADVPSVWIKPRSRSRWK